jgi:hypothetical protein
MNPTILAFVHKECDFIDLKNNVCNFIEAGGHMREYKDSFCPFCLIGLKYLQWEKENDLL